MLVSIKDDKIPAIKEFVEYVTDLYYDDEEKFKKLYDIGIVSVYGNTARVGEYTENSLVLQVFFDANYENKLYREAKREAEEHGIVYVEQPLEWDIH